MHKIKHKILGITPHTRYLAIAILYGTDLREWIIKTISGKSISEKVEHTQKILSSMVDRYQINKLVIKRIDPNQSSKEYEKLVSKISTLADKKNISLHTYSLEEIKSKLFGCTSGINKSSLMEEVLQRFPCLFREHEQECKNKNPYYVRIFEAIAAGLGCLKEVDTSECKSRKKINLK